MTSDVMERAREIGTFASPASACLRNPNWLGNLVSTAGRNRRAPRNNRWNDGIARR